MGTLHRFYLYLSLLWNRVVFWTFPTPEETYYSRLGTIHFEMGNFQKAISAFLKSENSHHSREVSLSKYNSYYLGHSYLNLGKLRDSAMYLERYSKLSRDDDHAASLLGWCYSLTRENEKALQCYYHSLSLKANSPELQIECGRILSELGRKEEALQLLEQAEHLINDPIEKTIVESFSFNVSGDITAAIEKLQDGLSRNDADWAAVKLFQKEDAFMFLARLQNESGDSEAALRSIESAFSRNPTDIWLLNELAMTYADQAIKLDKALDLIEQALKHQPENPFFLSTKGWVLFKMGRTMEAKAAFEKPLLELPNDKEIREHYRIVSSSLLDEKPTKG